MNKEERRRKIGKGRNYRRQRMELKSSWRGDFIHKVGNLSSLFPEEVEISNELITRKP